MQSKIIDDARNLMGAIAAVFEAQGDGYGSSQCQRITDRYDPSAARSVEWIFRDLFKYGSAQRPIQ